MINVKIIILWTMEIENPYLEIKRKLIVAKEKANTVDKLEEISTTLKQIQTEERNFIINKLNELSSKVEKVSSKNLELKNDSERKIIKPMEIYKQSCNIYKECYSILLEIREIKKQVRNEIFYKNVR